MQFLKISDRQYIRYGAIIEVAVTEADVGCYIHLRVAGHPEPVRYRHYDDADKAESAAAGIVREISNQHGATLSYGSTRNDERR